MRRITSLDCCRCWTSCKIDPTRDNWKKVQENLNSQCQSILSLSYSYLPQHLKACFLYVGCFPEDMEIGVSKLIKLWIAELFVWEKSNKRLEMVAEEYLEKLIDRSLIFPGRRRANGRMKTCKIHDLLRQLCIREAQIENFVLVLSGLDDISMKNCQRRAMLSLDKLWNHLNDPSHLSCITSTTSSLVFTGYAFRVYEMPLFVLQFKLLKVLDISSVNRNFSWVISVLVHLRYVAANIDEAPSLVKLWNLQTIILRNHSREDINLPQEIWTMSEIRHPDIRWSIHMPNPPEAESHNSIEEQPLFLNNLQTLFLCSSPFLAEILRRTPNLKKLQIVDMKHTNWPAIFDSLILLRELETLAINAERNFDRIILPRDIFLPNLKQLRLSSTYFPWEDMVVLANLPNLEVLKTCYAFQGTEWRLNEDVVFHKLKYLRIESLYILKRWEASSDNFPMLEQLLLFELQNLEEIPQSVGEIMPLKFIKIHRCSSTAVTSAMKIQEEQTNCGNDSLEVRIIVTKIPSLSIRQFLINMLM